LRCGYSNLCPEATDPATGMNVGVDKAHLQLSSLLKQETNKHNDKIK
jgi:hypothetical protein